MTRLRKLEKQKVTPEQLTRGALAGGVTGTLARTVNTVATGALPGAVADAVRAPGGLKGKSKALGKSVLTGLRESGGAAAGGATYGAALPSIKGHLDREAEKSKLREYVGESRGGAVRNKAKKYLGV